MRRLALLLLVLLAGCHQPRQYPLKGQILRVGPADSHGRIEVAVQHEDIQGFMPAMKMAYSVKDPHVVDGLAAGDLFTGTLNIDGTDIYLTALVKTGHAPVPPDAPPPHIMDVMGAGDPVPDDPMQDQDGKTRRLSDWRGQALAVTFVYTRCPLPDFCPLMDEHFTRVQDAIKKDPALRRHAHLVTISFDPSHDTVAVIKAHAEQRGADPSVWTYLTGSPASIDHITSRFGLSAIDANDAVQSITHNLRTTIVDPAGKFVKVYTGNQWTVDQLLNDLRVYAR